jgi:hypothetical protein
VSALPAAPTSLPMSTSSHQVVVLVEGHSDAVALEVLCRRAGLAVDGGALVLRDMHGVTNVGRHLREMEHSVQVLGLCDFAERRFVARALRACGLPVASDDDLPRWGFEVCDRDLEDELVRALGTERVLEILEELGELSRFRALQRQPQWRGRDVQDQLRRFSGTHSGRKAVLAERLTSALEPGAEPAPLARLVAAIGALRVPGPHPLQG